MRFVFLFLFIASSVLAKTPVGFSKWQVAEETYQAKIGGSIENYQDGTGWKPINNTLISEGDTAYVCETAALKTRIDVNSGLSTIGLTYNGNTYAISQRLYALAFLKMSTDQRFVIDSSMNWNNPVTDSTSVLWNNVSSGVNYGILKEKGQVHHGIIFKPAFLDSAVALYNQREDSLDIALANVMIYTLSANIDHADSAVGKRRWRKFKQVGRHYFSLSEQRLHVAGQGAIDTVEVQQLWQKMGNVVICIEYVPMTYIKSFHELYPNVNLWHNATADIETPDVEDGGMRQDGSNSYGGSTSLNIWGTDGSNEHIGIFRCMNIESNLGAGYSISACELNVYAQTKFTNGTFTCYNVMRYNWVEGTETGGAITAGSQEGMNSTYWDNNAQFNWTDEGTDWPCANDDGTYNTYDGSVCNQAGRRDTWSTGDGGTSITATGAWSIDCTDIATDANAYDSLNVALRTDGTGDFIFSFTEHATSGNRPYFTFTYTIGGGGDELRWRRRRILLGGENELEKDKFAYRGHPVDPAVGR